MKRASKSIIPSLLAFSSFRLDTEASIASARKASHSQKYLQERTDEKNGDWGIKEKKAGETVQLKHSKNE